MVGRISGTTGQFEYKVDSGREPGRNRFAEDKKKSTDEMFFFKSCAFFVGLNDPAIDSDHRDPDAVPVYSWRKFGSNADCCCQDNRIFMDRPQNDRSCSGRVGWKGIPEFQRKFSVDV